MSPVEPKDVMTALLGGDVALLAIGLALLGVVVTFYTAFRANYPLGVYMFYWIEGLIAVALALISAFACSDWLVSRAYSHSSELDTEFNIGVRFFDLALFALAVTSLSMSIPFIVEQIAQPRASDGSPRMTSTDAEVIETV